MKFAYNDLAVYKHADSGTVIGVEIKHVGPVAANHTIITIDGTPLSHTENWDYFIVMRGDGMFAFFATEDELILPASFRPPDNLTTMRH